jgi:hypothetical protein
MCSYFMAVLSPEEVAVKSPPIICGSALQVEDRQRVNGNPFPGDLGFGFEPYEILEVSPLQDRISSVAANLSGFGSLAGVVYKRGVWRREFEVEGVGLVEEYAILEMAISATVRCSAADSAYMADVIVSASFRTTGFSDEKGGRDSAIKRYYSSKQVTVPLPSFCLYSERRDQKTCLDQTIVPQDGLRLLESPVEISVSGATATILGDEHELVGFGGWSGDGEISPLVESAIADFSAEFRVTSRPSCQATDCSCGQSLAGISVRFYGETFTVGNEPEPLRGPGLYAGQYRWEYTDSTSSPVVEYYLWDDLFENITKYVRAEIFCSSDQQADGNVGPVDRDAWYLIVYSHCYEWDGGNQVSQTIDTYVGAYECYEHCGKFLPFGTPNLMYLVSSVTAPGLNACDPLPSTSVVIDFAGCP